MTLTEKILGRVQQENPELKVYVHKWPRSLWHEWEGVLNWDGQSSGGLARKIVLTQDGEGSLVSARRKVHKLEKQMHEERG